MQTILLFLITCTFFCILQAQNQVEITEIKAFHCVYMEFESFNYFEENNHDTELFHSWSKDHKVHHWPSDSFSYIPTHSQQD